MFAINKNIFEALQRTNISTVSELTFNISTFLSSLTFHEYSYYNSKRHNGTFMCNIISSIIEEEIINSVQLFQAFDMDRRISYWIFHIKHKNQERRSSGDKQAMDVMPMISPRATRQIEKNMVALKSSLKKNV